MYKLLYLPEAEYFKEWEDYKAYKMRDKIFDSLESVEQFITHDLLPRAEKNKILPHYKKNSYIYRSDTVIPKHLLEVIEDV